ncbi:hypothetical protein [Nocardia acidivorans]|uniref:hypothetical protein n=1 Tax=Nocardia acidivorans TaxID=404580 RepID=UPI00082A20A2|nr:hypothetical protein [Nocardia acidivorans]
MELFAILALAALPFVAAVLMLRRPSDAGSTPESPELVQAPPEYPSGWYVDELYSGRSGRR